MNAKLKPLGQAPLVDIRIEPAFWGAEPAAEATVRGAIAALAATVSIQQRELSVLLTDDAAIRALNQKWRGIDRPTNVLSFPAAHSKTSVDTRSYGDIVVAYETLKRECSDLDLVFLDHLAHLTAHGFLHLIGYNHETDVEAEYMEDVESKIMMRLGLPDPWRDRHLEREFVALDRNA